MVAKLGAVGSMAVGNLKNVSIIIFSVVLFHNQVTTAQVAGFAITSFGVILNSKKGKEDTSARTKWHARSSSGGRGGLSSRSYGYDIVNSNHFNDISKFKYSIPGVEMSSISQPVGRARNIV